MATGAGGSASPPAPTASGEQTLYVNGRIWQAPGPAKAEWMLVRGTKIAAVGVGAPPAQQLAGPVQGAAGSSVVDLGGRLVLPGLHDSHIHVYALGEASYYVNLAGCGSVEELQRRLREHAAEHTQSEWVIGILWAQQELGRYPTAADLDAAVPDRPVFLWRACWHIGCCNSRALAKCGLGPADLVPVVEGESAHAAAAPPILTAAPQPPQPHQLPQPPQLPQWH